MCKNVTMLSMLMFANEANSGPVCLMCLAVCKAFEASTIPYIEVHQLCCGFNFHVNMMQSCLLSVLLV